MEQTSSRDQVMPEVPAVQFVPPAPPQDTVPRDELGGLREVAEFLGVSRQIASNWSAGRGAQRGFVGTFPAPFRRLAAGPIFDMREVRAFLAANRSVIAKIIAGDTPQRRSRKGSA